MASLGHVAVGALVGRAYGGQSGGHTLRAMAAFSGLALLPDLDWIGVSLGLPHTSSAGHRGYTHSLLFAFGVGLLSFVAARLDERAAAAPAGEATRPRVCAWWTASLVFLAVVSHPILDTLCTHSRGVPLLWPFADERALLPWRPIPGAPTGLHFVSVKGVAIALIESLFFLPVMLAALFWRPAFQPTPGLRAGLVRLGGVVALVALCMVLAEVWLGKTPLVAWLEGQFAPRLAIQ